MYLRSLLEDWSCCIMPLESAKKWSKPQIEAAAPPVLHCRRLLQTVSQTHCRGRWNEKKGDLQLEAALEVIWGVERWFFSIFCSCTHVGLDFWVHDSFLLREQRMWNLFRSNFSCPLWNLYLLFQRMLASLRPIPKYDLNWASEAKSFCIHAFWLRQTLSNASMALAKYSSLVGSTLIRPPTVDRPRK